MIDEKSKIVEFLGICENCELIINSKKPYMQPELEFARFEFEGVLTSSTQTDNGYTDFGDLDGNDGNRDNDTDGDGDEDW